MYLIKTKHSPTGSVVDYMENNVFSVLFPVVTNVLLEAVRTDSLSKLQTIFDPLDLIAEKLWNNNPKYPERLKENLSIHDMPWAKQILKDNPRPYFKRSWIYTPEEAATTLQAYYRGYLVRKRDDVQEMRQFWLIIKGNFRSTHDIIPMAHTAYLETGQFLP